MKKNFIETLTPAKKELGKDLDKGYSAEQVAKRHSKRTNSPLSTSKAFVTMVMQAATKIGYKFNQPKVAEVKVSNPKDNYRGVAKEVMRYWVIKYLKQVAKEFGVKKGKILTLSSYECIMELIVATEVKGFKYVSYEADSDNYKKLVNNIKANKWDFMLKPINKYIIEGIKKAKADTYSHLFLDFCLSLKAHREDIELALSKNIVKVNGLVWITISSRGGKDFKTSAELHQLIKNVGGNRYKVLHVPTHISSYRDSSPMYSIILQRVY